MEISFYLPCQYFCPLTAISKTKVKNKKKKQNFRLNYQKDE